MSNVFSFAGRLGRDAEVQQTPSGQTVLNVAVANDTGYGDNKRTMWVRVAVWGKRAEGGLKDYLVKGQQVFVSGELSQREYQASDGTTKTTMELQANIIELVGGGNRNEQQSSGQQAQSAQPRPAPTRQPSPRTQVHTPAPAKDNFDYDDDIPF